jgi:hypothetical protein
MFLRNNNADSKFNYALSGNTDYLYEEVYLARTPTQSTDGFLTQQLVLNDGGFKHLTLTSAELWLTAVNLKTNFLSQHLSLYSSFGWTGVKANLFSDKTMAFAFETGAAFNIIPNRFEIYFPIKLSSDLKQLNYAEKIRFTLHLNTLNPFKMMQKIGH